jgi:uncharacterized protein YdhG (YjbR/CyaY superfamily)
MAIARSVDAYMAALPDAPRIALGKLRESIRAAAPNATETISYQMPTFKLDGRFLVSYAAYKNHCSLFPASTKVRETCGDELTPYLSGKGTIRFTTDRPLSAPLVRKIVRTRVQEISPAP